MQRTVHPRLAELFLHKNTTLQLHGGQKKWQKIYSTMILQPLTINKILIADFLIKQKIMKQI